MAVKLDTDKPIFLGKEAAREGTVVDHIRKAVAQLDAGEGVKYSDLEAYMLRNFTPGKSSAYSASYVKSYVRDAVNKYGQLSHTNEGVEYSAIAAPERKAREKKPRKPTKADEEKAGILRTIRDNGNIADVSQLDSSGMDVEDLAKSLGRQTKTVDRVLEEMVGAGNVRVDNVQGNVEGDTFRRVFLTPAGYASLNAAVPEGAGSDEEAQRAEAVEEQTQAESVH